MSDRSVDGAAGRERDAVAFAEVALNLARQAGATAEVYWSFSERLPVSFEAGRLKRVETTRSQAFALRVLHEGRIGLSSTTVADDARSLVERAMAGARYGPPAEFSFPPGGAYGGGCGGPTDADQWWDERIASLPQDMLVEWGKEFVAELGEVEPGALAHASLERQTGGMRVVNSAGLDVAYRKTVVQVFFAAELTEEGNFLHVYNWDASSRLDLDPPGLRRRVLEDLTAARQNVTLPAGEYPVVLGPRAVRDLLGPVLACVDGRAVRRGISPWRNRLGEQLFHPSFALIDDGRLPAGPASGVCDDEGVATQRTPIVQEGILRNFLLDLESAAALGKEPTGNATRGELADGPPQPRPTNLVLLPGDRPAAELLGTIEDGLLVENFMGAWSGNLYAGVVTGNVALGFRLKGGQRVGRVKDCMLSVNAFTALRDHLGGLSRETVRLGDVTFPYVLLERATVTSRSS